MRCRRYRKFIGFLFVFLFLVIELNSHACTVRAAWLDTSDSAIYGSGLVDDSHGYGDEVTDFVVDASGGVIDSVIGTLLGELLIYIGDSLNEILWLAGIGLDSIIFGRVNGASRNGIAMFTFELAEGNIYGIVGMGLYSVLSGVFIIFLLGIMVYNLVAFIYTDGGPRAREALKETTGRFFLSVISIVLFSQALNIMLYIKDLILYSVISGGNELYDRISGLLQFSENVYDFSENGRGDAIAKLFSSTSGDGLVAMFRREAVGLGIMNSVLYLGSIIITIYYAFSYIGVALSMTVTVALFPAACVFGFREKDKISLWFRTLISFMATPVIDAILLYIPLTMSALNSPGLIILVSLFTLIPARNFVRSLLNFERPMDVTARMIATAIGAAKLGSHIGKGVSNKLHTMEDSAAMADSMEAKAKNLDDASGSLEREAIETAGDEFMRPLNNESLEGLSSQEKAVLREKHVNEGLNHINTAIGTAQKQLDENNKKGAAIGAQIASIDSENENLKWMAENAKKDFSTETNGSPKEIYQSRISENMEKRAALLEEQKDIAKKNSHIQERKNDLVQRSKKLTELSKSLNQHNTNMGSNKVDSVLSKQADVRHVETPAYNNISLEKKAELYRARSKGLRRLDTSSLVSVADDNPNTLELAIGSMKQSYSERVESPVSEFAARPFVDNRVAGNGTVLRADKSVVNNYRSDWENFSRNPDNSSAFARIKMDALAKASSEAVKEKHSRQQEYTGPSQEEAMYRKLSQQEIWEKAKAGYVESIRRSISEHHVISDATIRHPDYDTEVGADYIARQVLAADEKELLRKLSVKGILKGDVSDFVNKQVEEENMVLPNQ